MIRTAVMGFSNYYIIHFEINGDPCNLIGSRLCGLFSNHTVFCSKSYLLYRVIHVPNCAISVFKSTLKQPMLHHTEFIPQGIKRHKRTNS